MAKKKKKSEFDIVHCSVGQIKELEQEITHLENMYKADQLSGRPKIQDVGEFHAEINKKKKVLADHKPKKLRGQKANKMYKEAERLGSIIKDAMITKEQQRAKYPTGFDHDFERSVQQQMKFQTDPKLKQAVMRYKNIMRRIDPSDPTITNIELLRK